MAAITEEALRGEWFYIEKDQPFDRTGLSFYVLRDGEVLTGGGPGVVATYSFGDDRAVITFHRRVPMTATITLYSTDPVFDDTTGLLQTSATYTLPDGSDPLHIYGSLVRRIADFPSIDDVRRCAG